MTRLTEAFTVRGDYGQVRYINARLRSIFNDGAWNCYPACLFWISSIDFLSRFIHSLFLELKFNLNLESYFLYHHQPFITHEHKLPHQIA